MPEIAKHHQQHARRVFWGAVLAAFTVFTSLHAAGAEAVEAPAVSGRVLDASGAPSRAAVVTLTEKTNFTQVLGEAFVVGLSGGLAAVDCFAQDPALRICRTERRVSVRLSDDGRFSVPTPRGPGEYTLAVNDDEGAQTGPVRLNTDVTVPPEGLELPDLRLWDAELRTTVDQGQIVVGWEPMPSEVGQDVEYLSVLQPERQEASAGAAADDFVTDDGVARADARLVEDAPGQALVLAEGRSGPLEVRWSAVPVPYLPAEGAPPSRGLGCAVELGAAPAAEVVPSAPCWLTDGSAGTGPEALARWACREEAGYYRCRTPPVASAVLDLGTVRSLDLVVLRGCPDCTVSTSQDGVRWDNAARVFDSPVVALDGRPARYVRLGVEGTPAGKTVESIALVEPVGGPFGELVPVPPPAVPNADFSPSLAAPGVNDLTTLTEVAVWEVPPPSITPEGASQPGASTGPGGSTSPAPALLVALAGALVLAAGAAALRLRQSGR